MGGKMLETLLGRVRHYPKTSIVIALLSLLILYKLIAPTPRSYEYVSENVQRGDVVRAVTASGKLRALNTIKVGAEVSGQVTRVLVDFNSQVTAGQVLAEIDPTRFRARVQQSQAQVALAQASAAQADAAILRARTDLEIQTREYGRQKELTQSGFVSRSRLDATTNLLAAASAGVRSATAQMASARAQIAQSNAELSSSMLDLRRTVIIAPTSGVVINKLVEPGTTVAASFQTPNLFEIAADTTRMQVEASVDEADIGQVRDGQAVSFTVDAYPESRFPAVVRQIRKASTEVQNVVSYLVILEVDNKDGRLLPGMTANVEIVTGKVDNVVRIPTIALRFQPRAADQGKEPVDDGTGGKAQFVYVATADPFKPARRRVTIGLEGESFAEVRDGLQAGEKLVVRSHSIKPKAAVASNADEEEPKIEHPGP
jgi:HlyD family secretion protein